MNSSVWAIWAAQAVRQKSGFELFWASFEGVFLGRKNLKFLRKYFSNRTKKHKKAFINFYLEFFCRHKVEKIGYHSRFNPECNTERGCIDSLCIALGVWPTQVINIYSCLKWFCLFPTNLDPNSRFPWLQRPIFYESPERAAPAEEEINNNLSIDNWVPHST